MNMISDCGACYVLAGFTMVAKPANICLIVLIIFVNRIINIL